MRCVDSRRWRRSRGVRRASATGLQAELFPRNVGALTEVFDCRPRQSVAFPHGRQIDELQGNTAPTPEVYEARPELRNANGVLRVTVVPGTSDEFSQSGHLGEGWSHVLRGGAGSCDSNLGRLDDNAVRFQHTELEHGRGELQS